MEQRTGKLTSISQLIAEKTIVLETLDPIVRSGFTQVPNFILTDGTLSPGAKLTYAHSASWGVWIPHVQAEWQHEYKTDPGAVNAYFLYDPTKTMFSVHGEPVDSDFFRLGFGMSFVFTHGRSGFFYYERLLGRDRITQNNLALGLRLEF